MDIGKLFNGIAVIIDDEINDDEAQISNIKKIIESKNIPIVLYDKIPQIEVISALSNSSFIILDWDYSRGEFRQEGEEKVTIGATLGETQEKILIDFIKELMKKVFIPVFIFTFKDTDNVKEKLLDEKLWENDRPNRIFIKQKSEISTESDLFSAIEKWIKEMPSVYVLKEWEKKIDETKCRMFLEMYNYSPRWAQIMWKQFKEDSIDNQRAFGEFITRNLINQIEEFTFDDSIISSNMDVNQEELRRILQGERYLAYNSSNNASKQVHMGDLFKDNGDYFLNIRAECDTARSKKSDCYNPNLYCIKGKRLNISNIIFRDIKINDANELEFDEENKYDLNTLAKDGLDLDGRKKINELFNKHYRKHTYFRGTFLERNDKVIITCVADELALEFDLEIIIKEYEEIIEKRIGRVLPPFITRIQQKCAQHMIREGVTPTPPALFNLG